MNVSINGVLYENVSWNDGVLALETSMTLAQIEEAFTPGADTQIVVYENGTEVGRYYNKGLDTLSVSGSSPRIVTVRFNITQITANAETEIRESMEYSDEAIEELAAMIAAIAEMDIETLFEQIKQYFTSRVREENGIFQQFDTRIRALEDKLESKDGQNDG